jgi:hypothetical protein
MEEMRNSQKILVRKSEGRHHLGEVSVDRRIILKLTLKEWSVRLCIGFFWLL